MTTLDFNPIRRNLAALLFLLLVGVAFSISGHGRSATAAESAPTATDSALSLPPDITVAADGTGDFKTVQEAVASIPRGNRERKIVLIKPGVYKEKVRVDASNVTLRGENRENTRLEFSQLADDFTSHPDDIGRAVLNVRGDDFVMDNLTVVNTAGVIGKHAFAIFGNADRTVIINSDVLSEGNDTVSLWKGDSGRYYHANCNFRGSVDFVCPRGWCYVTDCTFYEVKPTAAVWHDGHVNEDMKYVLRNCKFDGVKGWCLARHHVDAQFYFLDCTFSNTMADRPPRRVIYPLSGAAATDADKKRNADLDKQNIWGERVYFYNCHRDGGDYAWFADNLSTAPGSPTDAQITPAWTFNHTWDPEHPGPIAIKELKPQDGKISLTFNASVTVKGKPRLTLQGSEPAEYVSGSGTDTLIFKLPSKESTAKVSAVDLNGGVIVNSEASATLVQADLTLPATKN
ncbi:MAG TPA: pectinesterase family protein [Pirellulales bacterium]|nr:pectinesterase family protein [Pirellulales bacterium]